MAEAEQQDLTTLTVDLLSAYFSSNAVESARLSDLIRTTHAALHGLNTAPADDTRFKHVPAVGIRKSLASPDFILSMIDGRPYRTLKHHLGRHGLTPSEYRERYKLPKDYPLVATSYSEHRRKVAADIGLGRNGRLSSPPNRDENPVVVTTTAAPAVEADPQLPAISKGRKTAGLQTKKAVARRTKAAEPPQRNPAVRLLQKDWAKIRPDRPARSSPSATA